MKNEKTLRQSLMDSPRIHSVILVRSTGQRIGSFDREYAIKHYGDMLYDKGYSEGNGTCMIWIY